LVGYLGWNTPETPAEQLHDQTARTSASASEEVGPVDTGGMDLTVEDYIDPSDESVSGSETFGQLGKYW
jgi:hypothetical protein